MKIFFLIIRMGQTISYAVEETQSSTIIYVSNIHLANKIQTGYI